MTPRNQVLIGHALELASLIERHNTTNEQAYAAALEVVERITGHLKNDTRHYRDASGRLLTRLDEVVDAILAGELAGGAV